MTTTSINQLELDWLISVDDHVLEPATLWQDRIPARYRDVAPRLVTDSTGEFWLYEDRRSPTELLSAAAGKSKEEFSTEPIRYDEMRAGCFEPRARLKDMDQAGILASLCFPSYPRFCGQVFHEASDKELALLCVRAYNDWMIDEWCQSSPGRFIPLIIIPLWAPDLAAKEMERCAGKGARGFTFSENPTHLGLPSIHDRNRYWEPVFQAANDFEMIICTHIGSSSRVPITAPDAPFLVAKSWLNGVSPSGTLLDWLFSGWFERLPNLKLALSEGGIGWIPYVLQNAEYTLDRHRYWCSRQLDQSVLLSARNEGEKGDEQSQEVDSDSELLRFGQLNLRQLFADHVFGCFLEDVHGLSNIAEIGVGNVMVETDYPHSDSTWPNSIEIARKQLAGFSDEDSFAILRGNAERLFRFTPADPPTRTPADRGNKR